MHCSFGFNFVPANRRYALEAIECVRHQIAAVYGLVGFGLAVIREHYYGCLLSYIYLEATKFFS